MFEGSSHLALSVFAVARKWRGWSVNNSSLSNYLVLYLDERYSLLLLLHKYERSCMVSNYTMFNLIVLEILDVSK
jgi:hypothetical protein